jgi:23S rRNA (pseudouridine1915-N3)-methyltransferase
MKITLVWIGKTDESYLKEGIEKYQKRLKHYISFDVKEIKDVRNKSFSPEKLKSEEETVLLKELENYDRIFLLDEKGKQQTSVEFSQTIQKQLNSGVKSVCFVIGGAFGFSQKIYDLATAKVGLSKMTYSHQMVRLIFIEQLYRAFTILKGEKYHHI